mgnify:CR=1 FL=1
MPNTFNTSIPIQQKLVSLILAGLPFDSRGMPPMELDSETWHRVLECARQEGLSPLLFASLTKLNDFVPPLFVTETLQDWYRRSALATATA